MILKELGYNNKLEQFRIENGLSSFEVGRVILEHKERYIIKTPNKEYDAELMGNLRFTAESRYDFPAVGDWVAFMEYDDGKGIIHAVFPRESIIERKAVGKTGQVQIIATNIDYGLIVQAVDRDFNLNRLERYLTICHSSKVKPIIVLSKVDLISESELQSIQQQIEERIKKTPVLMVSNESIGYEQVDAFIESGKTYCLLGSSGAGKSTLLNGLLGKEEMKTGEISNSVNKGKHTTSHRELIVLANGGILIDNPGMREVGITDCSGGLEMTFESILDYAAHCKFKDCTHIHESDCAILKAVEDGGISEEAYLNFQKMEKEKQHFESDTQERRKKDKDFGKMIKNVKKHRKNNKY
ncbi:ribosome small subunit-dependent GTPase A [Lentimicrobium sp. S6]|uniref:ribosome small subunit-dependent GTPase A n=1 Tax=Lentimicrobium sp. S6 TaxID=2735872 RepID=UPI001556347E|nr:ribosome small subunit-dependent GTPase A [Lentimicrobium sp. S6]NPD45861.1 ribosome small subunit-dependent GTPase A [Lentimicrobium sp. S6]